MRPALVTITWMTLTIGVVGGVRSITAADPVHAREPSGPLAQARDSAGDAERERALVDNLRREDPAAADRYVTLRDARAQASAELERVQQQMGVGGAELRPVFVSRLKQARMKYGQTSLALLDFFEERDRRVLASYQAEISRINVRLEEHKRTRAELEKIARGE
jgi:hypothetical protein